MSTLHAVSFSSSSSSSSSSPFLHISHPFFRRSAPFSVSLPSKLRSPLSPFHTKKPLRATAASASVSSSSSLDYLDDSDPPLPPAVRTFWRWMAEEGVISSTCPLRPAYVAEGLGLVARRDIAEDEIILKVPRRLWVNPDTVAASEIGYLCTDLKPWVQVALFLIREKLRPNSWWRFYVDILPDTTNSTIFWSEEELAELKGTQLLTSTVEMKEHVKSQFLKVEKEIIIPNRELFPSTITLDGFYWAFGMIRSRAFSRLSGQLAMLPLVDFINHSSLITREDNAEEMDGPAGLFSWDLLFCLKSTIPVKEGEQAYIQYGLKKSSADMALYYGFVEPNSARDAYIFTFSISESDPYLRDKLEIAKAKELEETAYFDVFMDRDLPPSMLPYLRLAALKDSDAFLLEPTFRDSIWDILGLQVSRANEEMVCKMVMDACKSALSGYATTIEEDEKLLRGNLDPRFEMAVRVRAGEKRVLQQIEGKFKEIEGKLDELEYYHDRRLKELALVGDHGEIYCQSQQLNKEEPSNAIPSPLNSK